MHDNIAVHCDNIVRMTTYSYHVRDALVKHSAPSAAACLGWQGSKAAGALEQTTSSSTEVMDCQIWW